MSSPDGDTFTALWRAEHGLVRGYMHQRCPRHADDLTSQTFLNAWQGWASFRADRGPARGWLLTIAHNTLINHIRRQAARPHTTAHPDLAEGATADHATEVTDRVTAAALLAKLPRKYRQILTLLYLHDLPGPQVAALLGIPYGTVKSRAHNAIQHLRGTI